MDPKWNEPAVGFGRHRIFRVGWALHVCLREMESGPRRDTLRRLSGCAGSGLFEHNGDRKRPVASAFAVRQVLGQEYTRGFQIATRCSPNCNIKRSCLCSIFLISIAL